MACPRLFRDAVDGEARATGHGKFSMMEWLHVVGNSGLSPIVFDEPTQPRLTADGSKVKLKSEYMRSPRHSLWTELEYDIWNTNDLRFDYGRYQIMAGMKWDY